MLRSLVMIGLLIAIPALAGAEELPPIPAPTQIAPAEERAIEKNQPKPSVVPINPVPPETLKRLEMERPACGNRGDIVGASTLGHALTCCTGLASTSTYQHRQFTAHGNCAQAKQEATLSPPGSGNTCTQCGDGKCDEPEDSCNCPADCKK